MQKIHCLIHTVSKIAEKLDFCNYYLFLTDHLVLIFLQNWYCYSKTVAEREALQYAKETGLDVLTVCPSYVFGPMLQHDANASSLILIKLLKGDLLMPVIKSIRELFCYVIYFLSFFHLLHGSGRK